MSRTYSSCANKALHCSNNFVNFPTSWGSSVRFIIVSRTNKPSADHFSFAHIFKLGRLILSCSFFPAFTRWDDSGSIGNLLIIVITAVDTSFSTVNTVSGIFCWVPFEYSCHRAVNVALREKSFSFQFSFLGKSHSRHMFGRLLSTDVRVGHIISSKFAPNFTEYNLCSGFGQFEQPLKNLFTGVTFRPEWSEDWMNTFFQSKHLPFTLTVSSSSRPLHSLSKAQLWSPFSHYYRDILAVELRTLSELCCKWCKKLYGQYCQFNIDSLQIRNFSKRRQVGCFFDGLKDFLASKRIQWIGGLCHIRTDEFRARIVHECVAE